MAVERFQAPTKGHAFGAAPAAAPMTALRFENWLPGLDRKVQVRGPFGGPVTIFAGPGVSASLGVWRYDSALMFSGNAAQLDNHHMTGETVTAVTVSAAAKNIYGPSVRVDTRAYGLSDPATANALLAWPGTVATPVQLANGPDGAWAVAAHLSRLFVGGGSVPATASPAFPNAIWWSDLGGPTTDTLAEWTDDVSGLVNRIDVGSPGDPIRGLASVGRQLLVFKKDSIWTIMGDTPSSFVVRQLANKIGMVDKGAILTGNGFCLFVSHDGPMIYDASSGAFESLVGDDHYFGSRFSLGTNNSSVAALSEDYFLWVLTPSSNVEELWLFHLPTRSWAKVSANMSVMNPVSDNWMVAMDEQGTAYLYDGAKVRKAGQIVTPPLRRDESDPDPGLLYEIGLDNTTSYGIQAWLETRLAQLALPFSSAVVRRVMVDHFGALSAAAIPTCLAGSARLCRTDSAASRTTASRCRSCSFASRRT